ncbi:uncharacterized protein LOC120414112 [Culex pipiens pallens]|uniref:uncharacterized protein LOC120414112 n=1 Tax=Culex pipiens pallens TaxID=42434 RepID=UPI001952DEF5|nr:uncharacterized protein LOC120414112 [Culex pipiens pallens]XP_039431073.1 uncharacterized protein LOC120414112 [Culex pipiens pallens]
MTSPWTVRRRKRKMRRLNEYDEIFQSHLSLIEASADLTESINMPADGFEDIPMGDASGYKSQPQCQEPGEIENICEHQPENSNDPVDDRPSVPLKYRLAHFVSEFQLSVQATASLLGILRDEGLDLPMCRATLLETPQVPIVPKIEPPGEYMHFGIQSCLSRLSEDPTVSSMEEIKLDINIDGLPISKNGRCVWPILAAFPDVREISPFVIGCYSGVKEPSDFDSFLSDFVSEVNQLTRDGVEMTRGGITRRLSFSIRLFICDRPATCKITSVVSHVSKHGCPNCNQIGHRVGQVTVYSPIKGSARDDHSFRTRLDKDHHKAESISGVERISGLDMIKQIGVDPMHACHLGVTKRVLESTVGKVKKAGYVGTRLRKVGREQAGQFYSSLKSFIPSDFSRQPKPFEELPNFKATEFRLFDSYVGPLVTKKFFSAQQHLHFLHYYCALRLLSMPVPTVDQIETAKTLLGTFVENFQSHYGENSLTHNVHMLLHLPEYVEMYGNLPSISAFKYENFMQQIKRYITSKKHQVLQQLHKRLTEQHQIAKRSWSKRELTDKFKLKKNLLGCGFAYRTCTFEETITIRANSKDDCISINGLPSKVLGFAELDGRKGAIIKEFANTTPLFLDPIDSTKIGVCYAETITEELKFVELDSVFQKAMKIPFDSGFVIISLLHLGFD